MSAAGPEERPSWAARLVLAADLTSPGRARGVVSELCSAAGLADGLTEVAVLLVSEVVTNAVRHASGEPRLDVSAGPWGVHVAVGDDSRQLPARREADLPCPGGRGLAILDRLAGRWGVLPDPPGKVVWFELSTARHLGVLTRV